MLFKHMCHLACIQTVCNFSWQHKLFGMLLKHCSNFSACTQCCLNIVCCLNTVRHVIHSFPCVQTLQIVFRHAIHSFTCVWTSHTVSRAVWKLFGQCLDMFYTSFHAFEQPAMQWCAVWTLFEQFVLVWQCLNITHCFMCCPNSVWTCSTLVSMCLNHLHGLSASCSPPATVSPHMHICNIFTCPGHLHAHAVSALFFFLSFSFLFFVYS